MGIRVSVWVSAAAVAAVAVTGCLAGGFATAAAYHGAVSNHPAAWVDGPLITEPDDQWKSVYDFIGSATKSLDMTMYELVDDKAQQALVADVKKGVRVRVILDRKREASHNQPAFDYLKKNGVQVAWAPDAFKATHQKTITADSATSLILSGNLTSRYYATGRDFGVVDHDAKDVGAIEQTFNSDFASQQITPPNGTDLVWSPTNSQSSLLDLIKSAKSSLSIENEEMADNPVVQALVDAANRGVQVKITMTNSPSWTANFNKLSQARVKVATYAQNANLYIHAKVIIADSGQQSARAFIGSENFSDASLNGNRELGLITSDPTVVGPAVTTLDRDFAGATPWHG
jgi:cardiolipin synthase A/B